MTTQTDPKTITATLIAKADDAMAAFPQYAHKYDTWLAVEAMKPVRHRGLTIVPTGGYVLMDPASIHTIDRNDTTSRKAARGKTFATFLVHDLYGAASGAGSVSLDLGSFAATI